MPLPSPSSTMLSVPIRQMQARYRTFSTLAKMATSSSGHGETPPCFGELGLLWNAFPFVDRSVGQMDQLQLRN